MTEGILVIDKPQHMTSHDVVSAVRRKLGLRRVGHTGTLDPMATGVLPVCVGRSTRIMEYLDLDWKQYRCTMLLGVETDTQDIWGTVTARHPVDVNEAEIRQACREMEGVIAQTPPMYSAVKVDGKRLYDYARQGQTVEVQSRQVCLREITVEAVCLEATEPTVTLTVTCSKGTYIRTLCADIGRRLGCLATMSGLVRTRSGVFGLEQAVRLDDLAAMESAEAAALLQPTWMPLTAFGSVVCDTAPAMAFVSGMPLPMAQCRVTAEPRYAKETFPLPMREEFRRAYLVFGVLSGRETFLGVAFRDTAREVLTADKVFYARETVQ